MTTYYDILKISPEATVAEIEAAYEQQYNHWRRLVTHHDPDVVNKTNQALQWLEKARATLTDPARREAYDAGIGLRGPVGGLADPTLTSSPQPMTPPRPKPQPAAAPTVAPAAGERVDAWVCPKCQTASAMGTQFCKKCGNTLGKACPKCGKLIEATAAFCAECGVDIQAFLEEQKRQAEYKRRREQEEARRQAEEERRQAETQSRLEAQEREKRQRRNRTIGIVLAVVAGMVVVYIAIKGIADAVEQRRYYAQATATVEKQQADATATVDAFLAAGGKMDEHGVLMVYVPAGEFLMGSTDADADAGSDEKPQHTVYLDAFWIDRTEVTNAQYRQCVQAGMCQASNYADNSDYNGDMQPVVGVSRDDANAYCKWAGKQLPTEAQWEKAARSADGRIYPWGNQAATCGYAVMDDGRGDGCGRKTTWSVGSKPAGASPYGALDMAGNAWEWVADWYSNSYYANSPTTNPTGPESGSHKVLRGGGWYYLPTDLRAANRYVVNPDVRAGDVGFRCAGAPGQ